MSGPSNTPVEGPPRRRRGRPPLVDRGRVVAVAVELLDEVGLDALTMRRLAEALDVRAGTLYGHFATKRDLLDDMAEALLAGCADPLPPDLDWPGRVAELAGRLRLALLRHRDGARVHAGAHSVGPHTLGFADHFVRVLTDAGLPPEDALRAAFTVIDYTVGHTLEEQTAAPPHERPTAAADRLHAALRTGDHPHLAPLADLVTEPDFGARFAYGLRLLLRGLAADVDGAVGRP
ncbi:TetR/AcrR family transcriptional regulator C-terminal domain-containing protein [Streptomyces phytohabitans]|uniref:TetR/AcrR family transcriptional regulator C-terminal domain-containing protein n=1 Tax=Streptomyces phytohabitans TaxID=1150371 RepID=UPI00345B8E38